VIAGSVAGGLSFIAIVCAAIALHRTFTWRNRTYPFANPVPGSFSYTGGVLVTITQTTESTWIPGTRRNDGSRTSTLDDFGTSVGDEDEGIEDESTHVVPMVPLGAIRYASPTDMKPFLKAQGPGYPPPSLRPPKTSMLPLDPLPVVSPAAGAWSDWWGNPSIAYGMPTIDKTQTEVSDVLITPPSDASFDEHDREPKQHAGAAPSYANQLASVC